MPMKRPNADLVTLQDEIGADLAEFHFHRGQIDLHLLHVPDQESLWERAIDIDHPPYWATVWPAALGLARWLADSPLLPVDTLEIGCGIGLAGLVAAARGSVVAQTDYSLPALRLAMANARRNAIPASRISHWLADWRAWPLGSTYPRLIASDVLYDRELHEPVQAVLERALAPGGEALLADPCRIPGLDFAARLESAGWEVAIEDLPREESEPNLLLYRCIKK